MKLSKIGLLLTIMIVLNSCASGYQMINPESQNYNSGDLKNGVALQYKYDLLSKKYSKKEAKKGVKVVAVKITNNSEKDIVFGKDIKLAYSRGNERYLLAPDMIYKSLKQNTTSYLLYLLLTPMNLYTAENGQQTSSTPIGLVVGPGLAGGNMIAAGSANTKFMTELLEFDIHGAIIKKGETKFGLIGVKSDNYDAIRIKME